MVTFIFVQARLGSSRFKDKVLKKINNIELIKYQYYRIKKVKHRKKIVFLIPNNKQNISLKNFLKKNKIDYFLGSEKNVLDRYYQAAKKYNSTKIIRLTADCPLIDYRLIDRLILLFNKTKPNYISNTIKRTFPHGMDMEMFNFTSLEKTWKKAKLKKHKEHVTSYMIDQKKIFNPKNFLNLKNQSKYRITVDYKEDLEVIRRIINNFKPNFYFSSLDIVNFLQKNSDISMINQIRKIY